MLSTGSAAPRRAELGRACPDSLIHRGGHRPWGSYQRSIAERRAIQRFPGGVGQHRRQQTRLRLACEQPHTVTLRRVEPRPPAQPVQLDLVFRTERGTPINPNHASRAFARLAASVGLAAHPHLLRHALASAMAANKKPASIIAAQLRHADGGALAQRVYIHQLPPTAPWLAGVIEGVFGPAARDGWAVSAARRAEGNRREPRPSNPA